MRSLWHSRVARGLNDKPMIHVEYKGKEHDFFQKKYFLWCSRVGKMNDFAEVYLGSVVDVVDGWTCVSVLHCFNFTQR